MKNVFYWWSVALSPVVLVIISLSIVIMADSSEAVCLEKDGAVAGCYDIIIDEVVFNTAFQYGFIATFVWALCFIALDDTKNTEIYTESGRGRV